jgi:transposase
VNQVERLFAQIKQFRRMATRHEKVGVDDLAIVTLGQR